MLRKRSEQVLSRPLRHSPGLVGRAVSAALGRNVRQVCANSGCEVKISVSGGWRGLFFGVRARIVFLQCARGMRVRRTESPSPQTGWPILRECRLILG